MSCVMSVVASGASRVEVAEPFFVQFTEEKDDAANEDDKKEKKVKGPRFLTGTISQNGMYKGENSLR